MNKTLSLILSSWTPSEVPDLKCPPPEIIKRTLDLSSTVPFYDSEGKHKKWIPSALNKTGEWQYILNPRFGEPGLKGLELILHKKSLQNLTKKQD